MSRLDFKRGAENLERDRLNAEASPGDHQANGDFMRQPVRPSRARRLNVKFLQHLNRERSLRAIEQCDGPLPFSAFRRIAADRIQQDIGVDEVQP